MKRFFEFDSLIKKYATFYGLPWALVKAQIWQESSFNPRAVSPCGAQGLMQLMPKTDLWLDGDIDGFDPEGNIENGCRLDRYYLDAFPEIPALEERLKFMLASFNGGKAYVNKALGISYDCEHGEPIPKGHKGARPGEWQTWEHTSAFICSPYCTVNGKKADWPQILDYVEKVWAKYLDLM